RARSALRRARRRRRAPANAPRNRTTSRLRFGLRLAGLLAGFELDLLRLHLRLLRHRQREHAVAQLGLHVIRVDPFGQREAAREGAEAALVGVVGVVLLALFGFALAGHGQAIAVERDVEIVLLHARQIGFEEIRVLGLAHFERRHERGRLLPAYAEITERVPKSWAHHLAHHAERIPLAAPLHLLLLTTALALVPADQVRHCPPPWKPAANLGRRSSSSRGGKTISSGAGRRRPRR